VKRDLIAGASLVSRSAEHVAGHLEQRRVVV
jgi:hypothetical protein